MKAYGKAEVVIVVLSLLFILNHQLVFDLIR